MENKGFWGTKAGGLTIAFIVIMIASVVIMAGISMSSNAVCLIGFLMIVAAMLYSPVREYILKK